MWKSKQEGSLIKVSYKENFVGRCAICGEIISARTLKEFEDKLERHMKKHEKFFLIKKTFNKRKAFSHKRVFR